MNRRQFRVLYREFLFRIVDLDLLSAYAQGDTSRLLGQFAALLIFISLMFSIPALGFGDSRIPESIRLQVGWNTEHFLIATTMLVVGLFAVLSWDSLFPDRRDTMVLAPLPVPARTIFLAKAAAVASAIGVTVLALHAAAGLAWPFVLPQTAPVDSPAYILLPAAAPMTPEDLETSVGNEVNHALQPGMAIAAGVYRRGSRRIFSYGAARPDSLFEIGSISKTFTALMLAQMIDDGRVRLQDELSRLLPPGVVSKSGPNEITLFDLVTHRSGLPAMPGNLRDEDWRNPYPSYGVRDLNSFLAARGLRKRGSPSFSYSNTGYSVLGHVLARRAGVPYPQLLQDLITGPLHLTDTVISLSDEQRRRFVAGYDAKRRPVQPRDMDGFAPSGGIRSTAPDVLTFLEAQLKPRGLLAGAIADSHRLLADVMPGSRIAFAWIYNTETGVYWHNGATGGYNSYAFFHPKQDYAAVVLTNRFPAPIPYADILGHHIRQRFDGQPAYSLQKILVPPSGVVRTFAAYWITMLSAALFVFGCVLAVQGIAQSLPRQWFLRASSFLQVAAFCLFMSMYFIQPVLVTPETLFAAQGTGPLAWSPSYWFLGFFQQLNGSPALPVLAQRAWIGLAIALTASAAAYLLSYRRTMRKIVEQPDILPASRRWAATVGSGQTSAIVQFALRTLLRSRRHRIIYAFYIGVAFAIAIYFLRTPMAQQLMTEGNPWQDLSAPLIASTLLIMGFAIVGSRVVFSMPIDMQAHWVFRMTPVHGSQTALRGRRRVLLIVGLAPVWLLTAAVLLAIWPGSTAMGHLAVLAAVGLIVTEICLIGTPKLPFACSYLPGKSNIHITFWFCIALIMQLIGKVAEFELRMLQNRSEIIAMMGLLALVWLILFWRNSSRIQDEIQFEEVPADALVNLEIQNS